MQVFEIAPAGTRPLWVLAPVVLLILGVVAALSVSLLGSRLSRFEISEAGLRLRGDWYGRLIPAGALVTAQARRVDLNATRDLRPTRRTWGTGVPGYQAGWFRLANGEKALLYVTDRSKLVYVPTAAGYALLLSPANPDAFVLALRALGAGR